MKKKKGAKIMKKEGKTYAKDSIYYNLKINGEQKILELS